MDLEKLKNLILNINEPYTFKNIKIPWEIFEMTLEEWCTMFDRSRNEQNTIFVTGCRQHNDKPQWEKYRSRNEMTFKNFLKYSSTVSESHLLGNWASYSYKNIKDIPEECKKGINFNFLGFPDVNDNTTFWLGSQDAHTPCHYDTYGTNIVIQVFGKKMWLLFPPEAELTPVRVPYEESSVYCSECFFSPQSVEHLKNVEKICYKCVLEPGDILIVPNKWWHYVENLTNSLSINNWIPLKKDIDTHIEECIIKILIENLIKGNFKANAVQIMNPNEMESFTEDNNWLRILHYLVKQKKEKCNSGLAVYTHNYLQPQNFNKIITEFSSLLVKIEPASQNDFLALIKKNSNRYISKVPEEIEDFALEIQSAFINSVCNPKVVQMVKEIFLKYYNIS